MSVDQITLYTAKICPFAHRVELALEEAKAGYSRCEIDLANKPEWYAPQVNPASKVRQISFGGPQVPPEQPSPESTKIAESLILVEFVADLYPNSSILPKDPVQRAKARFFIDAVSTKFLPAYMAPSRAARHSSLFGMLSRKFRSFSPADKPYAIGDEYTAADIAITPSLRAWRFGEGKKAAEYFYSCDRFARLVKYYETIKGRESFKATFHPEVIKEKYNRPQAATVTAAA
ncbi:glutathione S-transferase [Favolaschia claudopus]|uniref:Glutathione S-transferase n=1 Tax=Favolaschia claudopus TaxID=2862362 RepID=A0AAW0D858_9AGAR